MTFCLRPGWVLFMVGFCLALSPRESAARATAKPPAGSPQSALPASSGDLTIGNVVYTVTDVGAHGWYTPPSGPAMGSGFRFGGNPTALFHAGLIVASDATHVEDACYGSDDQGATHPFNFTGRCPVQLGASPGIDQYAFARFTDGEPDGAPLGLDIRQHAYAFAASPNNDFIILEFDITNRGADHTIYVGWYADWDIGTGGDNTVDYDAPRWLGYMKSGAGPDLNYYGIATLGSAPSGFRAVYNPTWVYPDGEYTGDPGFEDEDKFDFLSGFSVTTSDVPADWSVEIGVGPLSLPAGRSVKVAFLMVAGTTLPDLKANVDAARALYPRCRPAVPCP